MTPGRDDLGNRRSQWVQVFGRLKSGYTVESARASLQPLFHQILEEELSEPALRGISAHDRATAGEMTRRPELQEYAAWTARAKGSVRPVGLLDRALASVPGLGDQVRGAIQLLSTRQLGRR